ncbi:MAG: hypothetical protein JWP09_19 [Candidatus Taylorbacteria bacterium]|nr:hypothetical protein [Candidatus Taylorbacteria bacterium]
MISMKSVPLTYQIASIGFLFGGAPALSIKQVDVFGEIMTPDERKLPVCSSCLGYRETASCPDCQGKGIKPSNSSA